MIGANTVTITPKNGGANVTVNVSVDALIEVGDTPATINDLTVGLPVEAEYDPTTSSAFRIEAETEGEDDEVKGTITAIDMALGTVTITDSNGTPIT